MTFLFLSGPATFLLEPDTQGAAALLGAAGVLVARRLRHGVWKLSLLATFAGAMAGAVAPGVVVLLLYSFLNPKPDFSTVPWWTVIGGIGGAWMTVTSIVEAVVEKPKNDE